MRERVSVAKIAFQSYGLEVILTALLWIFSLSLSPSHSFVVDSLGFERFGE